MKNKGGISDYLASLAGRGSRQTLEPIKGALKRLGDPQNKMRVIHVAGTNGKGSFCKMAEAVLVGSGFRVGRYSTPFLFDHTDSISLNGKKIDQASFEEICGEIMPVCEEFKLTEYEFLTVAAFYFFYKSQVDTAVIECCMGGRYDATNVVDAPVLSCITNIAYDHTTVLGDTLEKIAWQKAGIIRSGSPVLMGACPPEAQRVIESEAIKSGCRLYRTDARAIVREMIGFDGIQMSYKSRKHIGLSLCGEHQFYNLANILEAVDILTEKGYGIEEKELRRALSDVSLPARFERLSDHPLVIFDGAHNPNGAEAFASTCRSLHGNAKCVLISGVMRDKDYPRMAQLFSTVSRTAFTVAPDNPRAIDPEMYGKEFEKRGVRAVPCGDVEGALVLALDEQRKSGDPVICVGSLYMYSRFVRSVDRILLKK